MGFALAEDRNFNQVHTVLGFTKHAEHDALADVPPLNLGRELVTALANLTPGSNLGGTVWTDFASFADDVHGGFGGGWFGRLPLHVPSDYCCTNQKGSTAII